jgi:isopentenyl-diphosphate delta-isomerase
MLEQVVLVNENDERVGIKEKLAAHKDGLLHRAISVFVFNSKNELLLQKRDKEKYHSGGLWSNTCCSHPRDGEKQLDAAHRRLQEEMGFDCDLQDVFNIRYKVEFENGLIEHEFTHVFFGRFDGDPILNPKEAEDYKWITKDELLRDIEKNPDMYTAWFKKMIYRVLQHIS